MAPGRVSDEALHERLQRFVDKLKSHRGIRSDRVEAAFRRVPRHRFLERIFVPVEGPARGGALPGGGYREIVTDPAGPTPEALKLIYSDEVLVTRIDASGAPTSSSSMPSLMADMLEHLDLMPGHKVLEIGTGTGYNAALMAEIVGVQSNVVTLDIQADVAAEARRLLAAAGYGGVKVLVRDGFEGAPEEAPFDRLIATVGLYDLSPRWREQLAPEGLMLVPMQQGGACPLMRLAPEEGHLAGRFLAVSGFMMAQGAMRPCEDEQALREDDEPGRVGEEHVRGRVNEDVRREPGWFLDEPRKRLDFWFYLTAVDRRAGLLPEPGEPRKGFFKAWTYGLRDAAGCVVIGEKHLCLAGDWTKLRESLEAHRREWERIGAPRAKDARIAFIPKDAGPPPHGLPVLERIYHWQTLSY